jgi:Domain of unknown function (DUF5666)
MTIGNRWLVIIVVLSAAAIACGRGSSAGRADSAAGQSAPTTASDTTATVRGTVVSLSATTLVIKADTGSVTVQVTPPLQVYDREPGRLADVKDNSFIGVTTMKQPDGSERATEIHIFPEALRGLGEGSRMMTPSAGGGNRMTNGAVSGSRMTNGTASPARMSNGSVANANGSSLVVQYAGGSQRVTVPPNTLVTEIKSTSKALAPGEEVVVLAKRGANGSLSATSALLTGK